MKPSELDVLSMDVSVDEAFHEKRDWDFQLSFRLPHAKDDPTDLIEILYEAGCDDATLGVGRRGRLGLDFTREAVSAAGAISSAIETVKSVIPEAVLIEIRPDLVNLSDIADLVGCSRQNIRKYAAGEGASVAEPFPDPVVTGNPSLWRLAEVARWLRANTSLEVSSDLITLAMATAETALAIQKRRFSDQRAL